MLYLVEMEPPPKPNVLGFWSLKPLEQEVLLDFYRTCTDPTVRQHGHVLHDHRCVLCRPIILAIIDQFNLVPLRLVSDGWAYLDHDEMLRVLRLVEERAARSPT